MIPSKRLDKRDLKYNLIQSKVRRLYALISCRSPDSNMNFY